MKISIVARANLPTRFGNFKIVAFGNSPDGKEHVAVVKGKVNGETSVPLRLHSECLTGDALGSLKCDCREQLETALTSLGRKKNGVLLYLRQEGRGIGLTNKIRAYSLQDHGYDTIEANRFLGFPEDLRDYDIAADMIRLLGVKSVKVLTNNPNKIEQLKKHGINVVGRIPSIVRPNRHNKNYLKTKKEKAGHLLKL